MRSARALNVAQNRGWRFRDALKAGTSSITANGESLLDMLEQRSKELFLISERAEGVIGSRYELESHLAMFR